VLSGLAGHRTHTACSIEHLRDWGLVFSLRGAVRGRSPHRVGILGEGGDWELGLKRGEAVSFRFVYVSFRLCRGKVRVMLRSR